MKAVIITEPGEAHVTELDRPAIGPGEVLVHSCAVGIGESDVELFQGKRAKGFFRYPVIPGHELSGEVVAVGEGVSNVAPGAKVVVESIYACGICRNCREGKTNLCESGYNELGFTRPGGLAEYVVVSARQLHVLPESASLEEAALLGPAAVVAHAFLRTQPRPGDVVVILGDGPSSLLAVQVARLYSPAVIAVLGFRAERLQLAEDYGATHTVNMSREDTQSLIQALSGGHGADLVFEGTGHVQAIEEALSVVKRGGSVLLTGLEASIAPLSFTTDLFVLNQISVYGVFGASTAAWTYAAQLFLNGSLQLAELISHRFSLEEYEDALDAIILRHSRAIKVIMIHE
ncbi:zinc-dependent alcohol dehydrogenase [Dictyobacter formicarum]|uniref:Alcohol dehydrogenase n=1 Tax=Dictyobacter formicarum TaxID=2778368 RepID=A0ABQ3VGC8_9CHLR|nr:alcohol dehydrogenase catalytic domain-containing protein [Dictyobacter formicarum]GHO84698.1 alcohol dehydrogenase [Dictyobacter formicarum]